MKVLSLSSSIFASYLLFMIISSLMISQAFSLLSKQQSCPYTLILTTSCLSPDRSRDQISIALGDAYGNKVVAQNLEEPLRGGGFEKCSSDTFQVKGQCLDKICSVYIYRTGPDGWIPETIEIYQEDSKSVKFKFNQNVPQNTWFGQNNCTKSDYPPSLPGFPPYSPTLPPPSPKFPPFTPTIPPPSPPYFPPETPTRPPPPSPRPSAAPGGKGGERLAFAVSAVVVAFAFGAVVV